jgi:hypothetical protein
MQPREGRPNDKCFIIGSPTVISADERAALAASHAAKEGGKTPLCAYRFLFTVHEQMEDQQLDLGPFQRTLLLKSGPGIDELQVPITGLVRSDIKIVGGDDKDRIPLGSFQIKRGARKTVVVQAPANVKLSYERVTTEALKVQLDKGEERDGQCTWKLTVEVRPNSWASELSNVSVVLKLDGPTPRLLYIPVTGNAYQ